MTTTNHNIATITDELRTVFAKVQSVVSRAEAEGRDLSPAEDLEVQQLTARMKALDTKRSATAAGETFGDLVRDVRVVAGDQRVRPGDSLGTQLVRSQNFTDLVAHLGHGRPVSMSPVELRAAGTPTLPPGGGYPALTTAPPAAGPLAPWGQAGVSSLFPSLPASGGSVAYLRDTRTGLETPISSTAPGALKPETALAPTLIEQPLVTLATWSKIANTVPTDIIGFQSWIDAVLTAGVYDAESAHIVATILGVGGILTVTPTAGAAVADTLLDAAMQVQARSDLPATGAIVAPNTFTALATSKAAGGGAYLSGAPFSASPSLTLWGQLQIVVSSAMAAGTALVVAGRAGAVYRRDGLRVDISDSNEDDFLKNLLVVRIEERVAFAVYRAVGFANVTGLVTP